MKTILQFLFLLMIVTSSCYTRQQCLNQICPIVGKNIKDSIAIRDSFIFHYKDSFNIRDSVHLIPKRTAELEQENPCDEKGLLKPFRMTFHTDWEDIQVWSENGKIKLKATLNEQQSRIQSTYVENLRELQSYKQKEQSHSDKETVEIQPEKKKWYQIVGDRLVMYATWLLFFALGFATCWLLKLFKIIK